MTHLARTLRGSIPLLLVLVIVAGCAAPRNRGFSPGREPLAAYAIDDDASMAPPATPLDGGHDRLRWPEVTVTVPVRQVAHPVTWDIDTVLLDDSRRRRGAYPTAASALHMDRAGPPHAAEAVIGVGAALIALPLAPLRMILGEPPGATGRSPQWEYERLHDADPGDPRRWFGPYEHVPTMGVRVEPGSS